MVLAITKERKGFNALSTSHNQVSHRDLICGWTDKTPLALDDELSKHTRVNSLGGFHFETSIVALTPLPDVLKFTRCRGASFVSGAVTRVVDHHLRMEATSNADAYKVACGWSLPAAHKTIAGFRYSQLPILKGKR